MDISCKLFHLWFEICCNKKLFQRLTGKHKQTMLAVFTDVICLLAEFVAQETYLNVGLTEV